MAFLNTRDAVEHDQSAETQVEGEIREFVRHDVATSRRREPESESEMVASNINSVLQQATATSVQEIDNLITELQTLRDKLHSEAARVQREIVSLLNGYVESADPRGPAVDQDHRRKPDPVEKSPRRHRVRVQNRAPHLAVDAGLPP